MKNKEIKGDFCDLCKKKDKDGYTFIEIDYPKHHELALCQGCRRLTLTKLFEQYMLEQDMQDICNDMLHSKIEHLRDLIMKHINKRKMTKLNKEI